METLLGMEIVDELDDVTDLQALARIKGAKQIKAMGLDAEEESPQE